MRRSARKQMVCLFPPSPPQHTGQGPEAAVNEGTVAYHKQQKGDAQTQRNF